MRTGTLVSLTAVLALAFGCGDDKGSQSNNVDPNNGSSNNGSPNGMPNGTPNNGATNGSQNNGATNGSPNNDGTNNDIPPDPLDPCSELECKSWCDEATWPGGTVPDASTEVTVPAGEVVVVDCDAEAARVEVEEDATLIASRTASNTLTVHGNFVVRGTVDYGTTETYVPQEVTAEIIFTGMTDDDYVGTPSLEFGSERGPSALTPMEILESDVGLWIAGNGTFQAAGVPKKAWSKLVDGAGPGDAEFTVEDSSGWLVGDRVALTPTAMLEDDDSFSQFDEGIIASVDDGVITLEEAPEFEHLGCTDCMRRGEAINLTRNAVVRSADDEAHAHIMVFDEGTVVLDSAELRWLGPEQCGGPDRRAALYFHQQEDASRDSSITRSAIWGGDHHFVIAERSNGITFEDVAGYDTQGNGFELNFDGSACGTRCTDRDSAPHDVVFREVIAAKVGVTTRESGCLRIQHRHAGFVLGGDENSGCEDCVATGVGYNGNGADVSGFQWPEGGGRPVDFTFNRNVAHNNDAHGLFVWHNTSNIQEPYVDNVVWSNAKHGIHWGAYSNAYALQNFSAVDNGVASIGVKAVPRDGNPRLEGGTIDDIRILSYVLVQAEPNIIKDMVFTGDKDPGVTQVAQECNSGDPTDPDDSDCLRVWLRFENPEFAAGMTPFLFGDSINLHALWEVRGFSSPDYPDLPTDFDLYNRDNEVDGGSYHADFDAWLVPR